MKVTSPAPAVIVRSSAPAVVPFSVPSKVTLPPVEPRTTSPVRVVLELKSMMSAVVVTLPAVLIPVLPVRLTAPSAVMSPAAAMVRVVVSAFKVTTPVPVVVMVLSRVIVSLTIVTPAAPSVLMAPLKSVVPVPSVWLTLAAMSPLAVTSSAGWARSPRRWPPRPGASESRF